MVILYVLAHYEEQDHGAKLNWQVLVEGGIFEFLHRIILTDIKPPVFHELMRVHGDKLNNWVPITNWNVRCQILIRIS